MLKETKRLLAVLLAVAFAITTFGSDFSFARVFAAEDEVVQKTVAEDQIDTVEWEAVQGDEQNEESPAEGALADGSDSNEIKEEVSSEDAASAQAETPDQESEASGQEVVPEANPDVNNEGQIVEESISENTLEVAVTENSSDNASTIASSDSASLSSSEEAATSASSDAASTEASNKKISSPAQGFTGESVGIHVEVEAQEGVFPAGTTMVVNAISDRLAIDTAKEALGETVQQAKGVDISFYNAEGQEIEPSDSKYVHVSISLSSELSGETFSVLHKDDAGNTEKVANANADGASFNANAFSVYIVAGEGDSSHDTDDKRAICTYTFYVDTTEFNTQLVKEGDTLAHPGIPSGLGSDEEFLGWFTSDGQEVKFGKVEHVTANSKVDAYAKIQTTYYLTFIGVDGDYVGGTESIKQQVDASRSMVIGHTGDKIFDSITSNAVAEPDGSASETNLFAMLDSAIAALKTPVADSEADKETAAAALDKTNRGLKNSLNNVLTVRAELGTQLNELESLDSLGSDRALGQTQQMSDLVDVDWNATISSYIMQQTALQASYKAFTDMQGLSLFQLNK